MTLDLQPTLVGPTVRLRPIVAADWSALFAVASDPLIWAQHPEWDRFKEEVFRRYFKRAIDSDGGLVIEERTTRRMIGSSSYYELDPERREVSIGYTFVSRDHWGGATNAEMKRLMLEHAFTWARTVWFHVGIDNERSKRAMMKIGARISHEGMRPVDGVLKPFVYFRIDAPPATEATDR